MVPEGSLVTIRSVAPTSPEPEGVPLVPEGRMLETRLEERLDSKLCKVGDLVHFALVYAFEFEAQAGRIRVPQGAEVLGHVVLSEDCVKRGGKSRLAIAIDSVAWEHHIAMLPGLVLEARQPRPGAGLAGPGTSINQDPFDTASSRGILSRRTRSRDSADR